ncbi:type IV secretory system conjugative DNA transfer family protein [Phaeobacter sp. JH20_24]|uniref:type IV secretory system conjugative DNA transfer family protein n=1 Tax=unclassified Phaeobacter TaxID=2621772 RepID=UPI003A8B1BB6
MTAKDLHGSSKLATLDEINECGFLEGKGLAFGYKNVKDNLFAPVTYGGDSHIVTVARTRSGKGTTQIIPSLLDHEGALLCIDPKGENAIITAEAREKIHGQKVAIFDPWRKACQVLEREPDCFNPLDMLADNDDLADDAIEMADTLIMAEQGGDSHWSDEAKAMCTALIIHLVTSPNEEGQRNLGRLREILSLPPAGLQSLVVDMAENGHKLAKDGANRIMQKSEKELSSVISTAQRNTHFLEGERVKKSLSKSTFDFANLKDDENPVSVYIVLPAERLNTHGRLLRLMVSMGIMAMVREGKKPKKSALFLLDEFAALGKLAIVQDAYGLMAGFGMQIHAVVQDLTQLQTLYGNRWQTFIGNADVLQVFGTRDLFTAEYISKLAGRSTIEEISLATADKRAGGMFTPADPTYSAMADKTHGRAVLMPEEIIRMPKDIELLFMPELNVIEARKVPYYNNGKYYEVDGTPKFRVHPDHEPVDNFWYWDSATIERFRETEKADEPTPKPTKKRWWQGSLSEDAQAELNGG